jgi:hydrogenase maturation protease
MFGGMDSRGLGKLVIGIGNEFRGDDAAGLLTAKRIGELKLPGIEIIESGGDIAALLELWKKADLAIAIDAVFSGELPGKIYRFEPITEAIPQKLFSKHSTHDFGLVEAIELSRVLDILPRKLIIYGIVGASFKPGDGLSKEVELAIEKIIPKIVEDISKTIDS